jgi:hypothetical protein
LPATHREHQLIPGRLLGGDCNQLATGVSNQVVGEHSHFCHLPAPHAALSHPRMHCCRAEKNVVLSVAPWEKSGEELAGLALW